MIIKTISMIADYFDELNKALGYNLEFAYEYENEGAFPLTKRKKNMVVVPALFNHKDISDEHRKMLMIYNYSKAILDRRRNIIPISPEILAKGICDYMHEEYIPMYKVEEAVRRARMSLYDDLERCSFFTIGDVIKADFVTKYRVLDIRKEGDTIYVDTERQCLNESPSITEVTLTEAELYEIYTHKEDHTGRVVGLRKNLFILSAPSATGKDTVLDKVQEQIPEVKKAVTATTRKPRKNEVEGIDYYFYSNEEFKHMSDSKKFAEVNFYDDHLYGTPKSEIHRYDTKTPLFLVVDFHGMREILMKYPLSTTIFLMPLSIETLVERIKARGDNSEDEIERRIMEAKLEIKRSVMYDYIVENDDLDDCVNAVSNIVRRFLSNVRRDD